MYLLMNSMGLYWGGTTGWTHSSSKATRFRKNSPVLKALRDRYNGQIIEVER